MLLSSSFFWHCFLEIWIFLNFELEGVKNILGGGVEIDKEELTVDSYRISLLQSIAALVPSLRYESICT